MKITWLGQAGLLFDNNNVKIIIDPYFSDSVRKVNPQNYRRVPVRDGLFDLQPNVMIFTHDHLDHYDPETAAVFLAEGRAPMTVLCPYSVWGKARVHGGVHNYVLFDRHAEWTEYGFRFRAVKAAHSDTYAIGVIIEDLAENKCYYVTGDTLYSSEIFEDLPKNIDIIFLPVNGVGNNMNVEDAVRFFRNSGAAQAVPYHVGMFDELSPEIFGDEHRMILKAYEEIEI